MALPHPVLAETLASQGPGPHWLRDSIGTPARLRRGPSPGSLNLIWRVRVSHWEIPTEKQLTEFSVNFLNAKIIVLNPKAALKTLKKEAVTFL